MPALGRDTRSTRLDTLTDDQIQARWAALLPKFIRWLVLSASASVGVFLLNHLFKPPQKITDLAQVAFQISSIFAVCFMLLTVAALYFRSGAWRKKSS